MSIIFNKWTVWSLNCSKIPCEHKQKVNYHQDLMASTHSNFLQGQMVSGLTLFYWPNHFKETWLSNKEEDCCPCQCLRFMIRHKHQLTVMLVALGGCLSVVFLHLLTNWEVWRLTGENLSGLRKATWNLSVKRALLCHYAQHCEQF